MALRPAAAPIILQCWLDKFDTATAALHSPAEGVAPAPANELTAGGYSRIDSISSKLQFVSTVGGGSLTNTVALSFGPATELWPAATHLAIWQVIDGVDQMLLTGSITGYTLPRNPGASVVIPVRHLGINISTG